MRNAARNAALVFLAALFGTGCGSTRNAPTSPYTPASEAERNTTKAESLTREAAALIPTDLKAAETLLREALAHDLYFGPAHNNLGVVFLKREMHYEAAGEFEWAKKLMPGHPDPRVNLALVLDEVGRTEEALASYAAALEVFPGCVPAIQGLALTTLRTGRDHPKLNEWLDTISLQGETPAWREWAARAPLRPAR